VRLKIVIVYYCLGVTLLSALFRQEVKSHSPAHNGLVQRGRGAHLSRRVPRADHAHSTAALITPLSIQGRDLEGNGSPRFSVKILESHAKAVEDALLVQSDLAVTRGI